MDNPFDANAEAVVSLRKGNAKQVKRKPDFVINNTPSRPIRKRSNWGTSHDSMSVSIETGSVHIPPSIHKNSVLKIEERFFRSILMWKASLHDSVGNGPRRLLIRNSREFDQINPNVSSTTFTSHVEYQLFFRTLHMNDLLTHCMSEFHNRSWIGIDSLSLLPLTHLPVSRRFEIKDPLLLLKIHIKSQLRFDFKDILLLQFPNTNVYIGIIDQVSMIDRGFILNVRMCFESTEEVDKITKYITTSRPLGSSRKFSLLKLDSVVTTSREFIALYNIPVSPLLPQILSANSLLTDVDSCRMESVPPGLVKHLQSSLNKSQYDAIQSCVNTLSGFVLLQGPPGTGKTKTVVGLLNALHLTDFTRYYDSLVKSAFSFDSKAAQSLERRHSANTRAPRILVCAPSNAGIDEIISRLQISQLVDGSGQAYLPDAVRLGHSSKIKQSVNSVLSLNSMADAFFAYSPTYLAERIDEFKSKLASIADYLSRTKHRVFVLSQTRSTVESNSESELLSVKYAAACEDYYRVSLEIRRLNIVRSMEQSRALSEIKYSILSEAHIVFSTLSGCSSIMLFKNAPIKFDLCIIDEAAQATELSTIIPLQFGIRKCILVGDPNQLPATVFLDGEQGVLYERSLFQRLQESGFKVHLLDTQYRMHPEISKFPSSQFYQGKLMNGHVVTSDSYTRSFHMDSRFKPFLFYNVQQGIECRSQTSIYNETEAHFISQLLNDLFKSYDGEVCSRDIGIITPYREQKRVIKKFLEQIPKCVDIEVDTVDGFQGREKTIIVMSCVRTSTTSIGFLSDLRRMNVSLTRAKYALWVVGHSASLSQSVAWRKLISHSRKSGSYRISHI